MQATHVTMAEGLIVLNHYNNRDIIKIQSRNSQRRGGMISIHTLRAGLDCTDLSRFEVRGLATVYGEKKVIGDTRWQVDTCRKGKPYHPTAMQNAHATRSDVPRPTSLTKPHFAANNTTSRVPTFTGVGQGTSAEISSRASASVSDIKSMPEKEQIARQMNLTQPIFATAIECTHRRFRSHKQSRSTRPKRVAASPRTSVPAEHHNQKSD